MKRIALIVLGALILWPMAASAHDVPDDVRIRIFLKPEGDRMLILVRIPASALIDILFPTRPESDWLDLRQIDGFALEGAKVWVADLLSIDESGNPLPAPRVIAARISRGTDASFNTYQRALQDVTGDRFPPDTLLTQDQASVDALLEAPIQSVLSDFSFEPRFARVGVRVTTNLVFLPPNGGTEQFEYEGDPETFHLNPTWNQAVARLARAGLAHFFNQTDYLLFFLCVALIFDRFRTLLPFVVAFAIAQSVALIAFAFGLRSPDQWMPLWGVLISAATVYAGMEAIVGGAFEDRRLGLAIVSGLLFGSGYDFALEPVIQFGGEHRTASMLAFNGAITISYLVAVILLFVAAKSVLRFSSAPRIAVMIGAAVVLRISWHRMLDRTRLLRQMPMNFPSINPVSLVLIAIVAALVFTIWTYRSRRISSAAH